MENEFLLPGVLAGIFTALCVLGMIRRNAQYMRFGLFLFALLVIIFNAMTLFSGEGASENGSVELLSIALFLVQAIVAFPKYPEMNFEDAGVQALGLRMAGIILTINAMSVALILQIPEMPVLLAIYHGIIALISLLRILMMLKGQ